MGVYVETRVASASGGFASGWYDGRRVKVSADAAGAPAVSHGEVVIRDQGRLELVLARKVRMADEGWLRWACRVATAPLARPPAPPPGSPDLVSLCAALLADGLADGPFQIGIGAPFTARPHQTGSEGELVAAIAEHPRVVVELRPRPHLFGAQPGSTFELRVCWSRDPLPLRIESAYGRGKPKRVRTGDGDIVYHEDSASGVLGLHRLYLSLYGKHAPISRDVHRSLAAATLRTAFGGPLIIGTCWS